MFTYRFSHLMVTLTLSIALLACLPAPHFSQFVPVPGGSNNHNYANVKLIVDVAQRTGADAVWAGWGHASENPKLPDALAALSAEAEAAAAAMAASNTTAGATSAAAASSELSDAAADADADAAAPSPPARPIVWIGPPSAAMRALGDKIGSTLIAQSASVPCVPWSGSGIHVRSRACTPSRALAHPVFFLLGIAPGSVSCV